MPKLFNLLLSGLVLQENDSEVRYSSDSDLFLKDAYRYAGDNGDPNAVHPSHYDILGTTT